MYGILAGCIAVMAMFLGLFALSVGPETNDLTAATDTVAITAVQTTLAPIAK